MAKKILITGAAGLIGRELYSYLKAQGHSVVGIDNWSRFCKYSSDIVHCSVKQFILENKNEFDYIYHLAAINGTKNFYQRPLEVTLNNNITDLEIFNYVETNPLCKLIYASSSEVIAGTEIVPTPEIKDITITDIHNPRWSYRLNKIMSENYLSNSSLNYVIIRFFNLFSEYSGSGHFVYDIVKKLKSHDFSLIGADETRSFCYVNDTIPALVYVSENLSQEIINIGSDEEISVLDAANIIAEKLKIIPEWNLVDSLSGSVKRRCPDLTKLKTLIPNYNPKQFKEVIKCMDI
jgi:nucleoside-diphosphate-sugar epimerase